MRQFDPTVAVKPLPVWCGGAADWCSTPRRTSAGFGIVTMIPLVDQPALNVGRPLRSSAAPRRWGWRSWRHEIRAPHGRLVSIVPRFPRDERASASSSSALLAVNARFLSPSLSFFPSSVPLFIYLFLRSRIRRERDSRDARSRECATTCVFPSIPRYRSRSRVCHDSWRFRDSAGSRGSSDSVVTIDDRSRILTRGLTPGMRSSYISVLFSIESLWIFVSLKTCRCHW